MAGTIIIGFVLFSLPRVLNSNKNVIATFEDEFFRNNDDYIELAHAINSLHSVPPHYSIRWHYKENNAYLVDKNQISISPSLSADDLSTFTRIMTNNKMYKIQVVKDSLFTVQYMTEVSFSRLKFVAALTDSCDLANYFYEYKQYSLSERPGYWEHHWIYFISKTSAILNDSM